MKCGLHSRQLISRYFTFFLAPLGSLCRFLAHTGALGRDQDGGILGSFAHFFLFVWTELYRIQTLWSSRPLDKVEPGLQKSFFRASVWLRGSKTWPVRFPAIENPNMEKALFDWPIVLLVVISNLILFVS